MADCIFCMIRDGKIPSAKVYDDQRTLAFMDINPLSRGHCLVVPKAHAATLYDAEAEDLKAAIATLIPRWTNDGKGFDWKEVLGNREEIMGTADRIRAMFG